MNRRPAFTLVELLVSIALVLILILGVNQVFKLTSDTIGASNGMSEAIRMGRSVQSSMFEDLRKAALPGTELSRQAPFFIIRSERISAFRSPADEEADRDYTRGLTSQQQVDDAIRTVDSNGDNSETLAEAVDRVSMGDRSHRIDQLSFFARDLYRRQTGNATTYVSEMTSNEAWIWYGHIKQPGVGQPSLGDPSQPDYMDYSRNPGWTPIPTGPSIETAVTNPNNFYARQWHLGRVANVLMVPETADNRIWRYDAYGFRQDPQDYIGIDPNQLGVDQKPYQPLGEQSRMTNNGTSFTTPEIEWSRYDLLGTSISRFEDHMRGVLLANPAAGSQAFNWWRGEKGLVYRFSGFPYPTKPMTSQGAARTVPCFIPACTQFVVEFAGDFITQTRDVDNNGVIDIADQNHSDFGKATMGRPDNVVDFIADPGSNGRTIRTRWYGFPRNVYTGDDLADRVVIRGTTSVGNVNDLRDVVPLRDVLAACPVATSGAPVYIPALFERDVNTDLPNQPDYGAATGVGVAASYTCAWGPAGSYVVPDGPDEGTEPDIAADPQLPKMIRLVVGVDDVDARMNNTQYYEYVVELP